MACLLSIVLGFRRKLYWRALWSTERSNAVSSEHHQVALEKFRFGKITLTRLAELLGVSEQEAAKQAEDYRLALVRARQKGAKAR